MKWITALFVIGITLPAFAQKEHRHMKFDKEKMEQYMPSMSRSLGGSFQQFNGLNGRVANLPQYKQLRNYTATLGLGWMKEMNRVVSDAGITIGSSLSGHPDEKSSTIRYIGFNAGLGYDVLKSEKITLYPLVGLGFQTWQAIFYKDNTSVDFNDVLESPDVQHDIQSVRFRNNFLVYRLGAGVSFKSPKYPSSSIGIQAGYTGSFKRHGWKTNEGQDLANAPTDRISQFYFSLIVTSKPWMMMRK
ncbi:MAG: hypothetical protein QM802_22280 [Agriterribacter sp.]